MESENIVKNNRNQLLNFLKGIACIGVVFIHIKFPGMTGEVVSKLFCFAVPVFFMIAGYYAFSCSEDTIKRRFFKILKIFTWGYFWFFTYTIALLKDGTEIEWLISHYTYKTIIKYVIFCTIDFAIPLWYLIAMLETYLLWFFVVKNRKENQLLKLMPILFIFYILPTTICETNDFSWFWQVNFISKALPWFLFGYYAHSIGKEKIDKRRRDSFSVIIALIGCFIALIPIMFKTNIKFSCIGSILYSISLFVMAIKHPKKTLFKPIEYIGDKLSLNIYIFYVFIADVISVTFKFVLKIDTKGTLFLWKTLITLVATIFFAFITEKMSQSIKLTKSKCNIGDIL